MGRKLRAIVVFALSISLAILAIPAKAAPGDPARITVNLVTPDGVPAIARLEGPSVVTVGRRADQPAGQGVTVVEGSYRLVAEPFVWEGIRYVADAPAAADLADGAEVSITWRKADGVQFLRPHLLENTEVGLTWDGGGATALRRADGPTPPASPSDGTEVAFSGNRALDSVEPNRTYSYALFDGTNAEPLTLIITTSNEGQPNSQETVRDYAARFLATNDAVTVAGLGEGELLVTVQPGLAAPPPGAAVVLPDAPATPGGFVGTLREVSLDGTQWRVRQAGLDAPLAYADVQLDPSKAYDLGTLILTGDEPAPTPDASAPSSAAPSAKPRPGLPRTDDPDTTTPKTDDPSERKGSCGPTFAGSVSIDSTFKRDSKWEFKWDKYGFLIEVAPKVEVYERHEADLSIDFEVAYGGACEWTHPIVQENFRVGWVPIAFVIELTAELNVGGSIEAKEIKVHKTSGVDATAWVGREPEGSILTGHYFTPPKEQELTGGVEAKVSLTAKFGPGAAIKDSGIMAGLGAEAYPLKLSAKRSLDLEKKTICDEASASLGASAKLFAGAWIGPLEVEAAYEFAEAEATVWAWDSPSGCSEDSSSPTPSGGGTAAPTTSPTKPTTDPLPSLDIAGEGVELVSARLDGEPEQWDFVGSLFAPHADLGFRLSTGTAGYSSYELPGNTDLGGPGHQYLTSLVGAPTFDLARRTVTVVPQGSTLSIDYLFETAEVTGWGRGLTFRQNDAAAIFIDGYNCAAFPSGDPITARNVTAARNSGSIVPWAVQGAYREPLVEVLATPLNCTRPVVPGKPVEIRFVIADTGDGELDSSLVIPARGITSR